MFFYNLCRFLHLAGIFMSQKTKSVLFMLLSALSFSMMSVMIKLAGDIPTFEKVFFRGFLSAVILFFWVKHEKLPLLGSKHSQPWLIARAVLGTTAMFFYFYGINRIYLADASMLGKLNPFFVTLFAAWFLKEKLSKVQIPALIIAFAASLLIIKPRFQIDILPYLSILTASMFSGGAHTIVRALKSMEKPPTIIFYFSSVSAIIMFPFVLANFQMPTTAQWFYLLGIGLFATSGQIGLTYAYRFGKASEIVIYSYTSILFAAVFGFIFWREIPDWLSITGGIIIVGISIFIFLYNNGWTKSKKKQAKRN